jgi:hypothetical protein
MYAICIAYRCHAEPTAALGNFTRTTGHLRVVEQDAAFAEFPTFMGGDGADN